MSFWNRLKSVVPVELWLNSPSESGAFAAFFAMLAAGENAIGEAPTAEFPTMLLVELTENTLHSEQLAWEGIIDMVALHNEPSKFTSLIGWEWSSTPTGINIHRVVFTLDGADKAKQFQLYGSDQNLYPEDLWL